MKNIAVILAGGRGLRTGYAVPKQFHKIAGRAVIEYTIDAFEQNSHIDEIALVMNSTCIDEMRSLMARNTWHKVKKILKGGAERYNSTLSAIAAYDGGEEVNLIFHDAVRPLVSQQIIDNVAIAMERYEAVAVAVASTDTIFCVDETSSEPDAVIKSIPQRKYLRRAQTPQAFRLSVIKEAYRRATSDELFVSTDDCGTVVKYMPEVAVHVIAGEDDNMKLTYKEDAYLIEKLLQLKNSATSFEFSN